jgi:carboxylesterase
VCHDDDVRSLPLPDHRAFHVDAAASAPPRGAALCVHGYTGTPYEVRPLADALAARGFACDAPLLTGHGDDPATLNHTPWQRFLDDVVHAWDAQTRSLPPGALRVVVGSSMGGLLALQLSLVRPVDAVVLLAPALRFHTAALPGIAALVAGLWRLRPFLPKESPGGDVGDVEAQRNNPTYKVLPTRGIVELWHLQRATEARLAEITAPVCALHGDLDATIAPSSSEAIAAAVSSPLIEHHRLRRTRHLVGLDVERELVASLALRFLADVEARLRREADNDAPRDARREAANDRRRGAAP